MQHARLRISAIRIFGTFGGSALCLGPLASATLIRLACNLAVDPEMLIQPGKCSMSRQTKGSDLRLQPALSCIGGNPLELVLVTEMTEGVVDAVRAELGLCVEGGGGASDEHRAVNVSEVLLLVAPTERVSHHRAEGVGGSLYPEDGLEVVELPTSLEVSPLEAV